MKQQYQSVIFVDSLSRIEGSESQFSCQLPTLYNFNRIQLNQFILTPNLISNMVLETFGVQQQSSPIINFTIQNQHFSLDEFKDYFNAQMISNGLSLRLQTLALLYNKIYLIFNEQVQLRSDGWKRMGFVSSQLTQSTQLSTDWEAQLYANFGQTPVIKIRFDNIPNSYEGLQVFSFQVPQTSNFGGKLIYNNQFENINDQVIFQRTIGINRLQISLLDDNGNLLQGDGKTMRCFMKFTVFND